MKASKYRAWIKIALKELVYQHAKPIKGPVAIGIEFPMSTRGDLDNRVKAVLDLMCRAEIIPDDNVKVVRAISLRYAEVPCMQVTIQSI